MTFLESTAKDIIKRYGTDLSRVTVVFPNKRASLFLNEYLLASSCSNTIWSPKYITISEFFRQHSKLEVADHIMLVCELYKVYVEVTGHINETLDEFYSWGELLLSDFDDIDKNLGKAEDIFLITSDHHRLDSVSYLSDTQKKAIRSFFNNFPENHESILKKRFEELWNRLGMIYKKYKENLRAKGIAYEGMLYRDVIESKSFMDREQEPILFVGFNLLQKVEKELFTQLKLNNSDTLFYWDFDKYYMPKMDKVNEAGKYISEYLNLFPNALSKEPIYDNFENNKDISYISASTEDSQARYISEWLTPERINAGKRTAIVLCNENLLPTVVNCLPKEVEHVNITSGYPLINTPIATLIKLYFNLHLTGTSNKSSKMRLSVVNSVLRNSYMKYISPLYLDLLKTINEKHIFFLSLDDLSSDENLKTFFTQIPKNDNVALCDRLLWIIKTIAQYKGDEIHEDNNETLEDGENESKTDNFDPLTHEALFRMYTLINRLRSLVTEGGLAVDTITFQRLMLQIIRTTTIPFHGEPIVGIQIMGVLETRNLDFDHLLILSCNEGNMPKGVNDSSFIPHIIRKEYGLTTIENKVAVYAYYFHRLLQRASDIELTYNASTEDGKTGEMSRFMLQLLAESNLNIKNKTFASSIIPNTLKPKDIQKDEDVMKKLLGLEKTSPSALSAYLRCQKLFFFKYICGYSDIDDDEGEAVLDNRVFGLIFHNTMETLYKPYVDKTITISTIESMIKDPHIIDDALNRAIKIEMFKQPKESADSFILPELNGNDTIMRKVVLRLIKQTLEYDSSQAPFTILGVEEKFYHDVEFNSDNLSHRITIKGIIDRMDSITGPEGTPIHRVVDYKTGRNEANIDSVESIFDPQKIDHHSDYYLQTMLYSIVKSERLQVPVAPALLYPAFTNRENYTPILTFCSNKKKFPILDASEYSKDFMDSIKGLLAEIFDKNHPFKFPDNTDRCNNCVFKQLCS